MIKVFTCCFFLLAFINVSFAQTFTGTGGVIPDDGNAVDFPIQVSGLPNTVNLTDFGLESVCFDITHTWTADLALWLIAPDGSVLPLVSSIGGDTDGFVNTCLSGNASSSIFQQWYPFTGTYRPFGDIGQINAKLINPNGTWTLHILDTYAFADAGSLNSWNITFGNQPCVPFPFESSDLPIIKINTDGQLITNEPKINAHIQVLDNGAGQRNFVDQTNFAYEGLIGIELRGFSSQGFPKKSYAMEVRDELGEDLEVSLLGLPKTSDFALMANFSDKTLMRNALAYDIFRQMGHYASRTRFCELVLDGTYQGIYILTEKIKRGENRVDIARLSPADTTGTDVTGGYIVRVDWNTSPGWNSQFSQPNSPNIFTYFQHEYPEIDRMHPSQINYIRAYVDSFEVALNGAEYQDTSMGWRRFADEKSFIDYLILNEISKNVDGYRLSTYFHKDRDDNPDGKLNMGPPWDYDLAFYNADYCEAFLTSGWAYNINYVCQDAGMPFWWEKLASDTLFSQNLACRWQHLRSGGLLSNLHIFSVIDSMAGVLAEAQSRNFNFWPILGTYVWPNPGALPTTHAGEVTKLKTWLTARLQWLDFAINQNLPDLEASFTATALNAYHWKFQAPPGFEYQWDFGDGSTSAEVSPEHLFPGAGNYTVQLTISTPFGCEAVSNQIIQIVNTGTANLEGGSFKVMPNPANEFITVLMPSSLKEPVILTLVNTIGQTVRSEIVAENTQVHTMQVSDLSPGNYGLEIKAGAFSDMVRIVIAKKGH